MKKTLNKMLKRNVFFGFKQFLSVIVIVFLSMTLYSGFLVNYSTLERSVDNYFKDTNLADIWVYAKNIDAEDEEFLLNNSIYYEKRLQINTNAQILNKTSTNNAKIFVYDSGKINTPYIFQTYEGCWIDQDVAKNNNIKIGQDYLKFDYDYILDGQSITLSFEFLVTGTMAISECADVYSSWPILIDKNVFITELNKLLNAENLGVMADIIPQINQLNYNQILIKNDNVNQTKTLLEDYYNQKENNNLIMILDRNSIESIVMLENEVRQAKQMIYVFPTIFLIVAILVMVTSINQLILQERMKIGVLKSLGAGNRDLYNHYSKYGALLSFIGSVAGLIVGPLVIPEIMFIKYDLVYNLPRNYVSLHYPFEHLLLLLLLFVLIGYTAAMLTCFKVVRKKPAESLKSDVKVKLKSKKKQSTLPFSLKMALRNLKIKPIRMVMAIIGVAGCVSLMLCGYGIGDTLKNSVDNDLNKVFSYDISTTYVKNDFIENLEKVDGIQYFEKYEKFSLEAYGDFSSKTIDVYKIEDNSQIVNFNLADGEVALSKSIAEQIGAGEKISLKIDGQIYEFKITKLIETAFFNGVYICDQTISSNYSSKGVWIKTNDNIDGGADKINAINGTNDAITIEQTRDYVENKISSISAMTTTLKIFALALAVVALVNFSLLILKERIKETATLKVLGKNLFSVTLSFAFEILLISLIGMIIGMIFGYPLLILVLSINKVDIMNFLYYISPISFIFAAIIIIATVVLVSLFVMLKIKKVNMIEALKVIE